MFWLGIVLVMGLIILLVIVGAAAVNGGFQFGVRDSANLMPEPPGHDDYGPDHH